MGTGNQISSLQSPLSHLWLSVTRARRLDRQQETSYILLIGCRTSLTTPLPQAYLGNSLPEIQCLRERLRVGGSRWPSGAAAGTKCDGKSTVVVYPGPAKGSMSLEVCLSPPVLSSLVTDKEFMEMVSNSS
ncbi:hypothetical protein GW17_00043648 [Ensete ventricosum]|nr:hypothetical protein GW17_00043648 [Ensete ventricosum]